MATKPSKVLAYNYKELNLIKLLDPSITWFWNVM